MLWSFVPLAILIAAVAYIALTVRRARREHQARSEERAAAMLLASHGSQAQPRVETTSVGPVTIATATVTATSLAESDAPAAAPPTGPLAALRRPRLLTDPQRLLYLVLRAALPDHVVMANMRLIDLLDVPAGAEVVQGDARLGALLHQRLDCVVCRNDLTPLAALVIYPASMPDAQQEQAKADALRELGIRFLRFRADALPRPAEMRALVLG